ncbi:MAG: peptidylprolyl isomerase [Proteobacteria bacterium]|nr:peptidylprolyl isomerase [Pseudomonadota bacterium]
MNLAGGDNSIRGTCFRGLVVAATVAVSLVALTASSAQEILEKIEVLVNDEVISAYDLQQRMGLVVAATGGVRNQEELMRLRDQVLSSMVDEKLQLQEAAEFEVEVSEDEINDAYFRVSSNFNQTPESFEQFLAQYGSSKFSLTEQLRAEFAWQMLVRGRLGSQVSISDQDVESSIEKMKANTGKYEYRLSEIYLILDRPSRAEIVKQQAARLIKQVTDGAQFTVVARQFSESATAARGGDLGWVAEDQMAPEVEAVVQKMALLEISEPIATPGGVYVIQLRDRRRILSADPLDVQLDVTQVVFPFNSETTQEIIDDWVAKTEALRPTVTSCEQTPAFVEQLPEGTVHSRIGLISLRDLGPALAAKLEPLAEGVPSLPLAAQDGIRIFFVCGREQPDIQPPDFDTVYSRLQEQRLTMMARRYLRDLRRDAIVDYR